MSLLHKLLTKVDTLAPMTEVSAHCDIPCKIYDPSSAQIAVLTMIRMVDLLTELEQKDSLSFNDQATFNRLVSEKEVHGIKVKEEVRVIWGDYIKQPQLDQFPDLHKLVHQIMLATSFAKQHIDREATIKLLELVNEFADIFWQTKQVSTYTVTCPYPPSVPVVYPDLKA